MAYARSVTVVDQTSSNLVLLADDAAKDSPFLDCVVGLSFLFRDFAHPGSGKPGQTHLWPLRFCRPKTKTGTRWCLMRRKITSASRRFSFKHTASLRAPREPLAKK
jgi:hypothetical protein